MTRLARPKSRTLATPLSVTKMLAGLTSRWTMPASCADFEGVGELHRHLDQLVGRELPPDQPLLERRSLQQLHDQKRLSLVLTEVVDGADVGVVERRGGARLALKALEGLAVLGHLRGQELDRHLAAEIGVLGLIDDPHAATSQLGDDSVVGNGLTDQSGLRLYS